MLRVGASRPSVACVVARARRAALLLAVGVVACASLPASAQTYPAKPVRVIVPNGTGGFTDIGTRLVMNKMSEALGQQFVVENRVGAGGTIGTAVVARAAPDGYTLLAAFDSHATNMVLFKSLEYDTFRDFQGVGTMLRTPMILVTTNKLDAKSVDDVVRLARAKPAGLNFAVVGPGSPSRLLLEAWQAAAGIEFTLIQYKGAGLALGDIVSGQIDGIITTTASAISHLKANRVRAVALAGTSRSALVPGLPTIAETYPDVAADSWVGLFAPAKVPKEIVATLSAALQKVLQLPDLRARLAETGMEPLPSTAAELDQSVRRESERWGRVIREKKITVD